jgi:hypothetical protein
MADLDVFDGRKFPLPGAEPQIIKSTAQVQRYPKFNVNNEVKNLLYAKKRWENHVHGMGNGRRLKTTWTFKTDNQIFRPADALIIPTLHNSAEITKSSSFSPQNCEDCCLCFLISGKYNNKATPVT